MDMFGDLFTILVVFFVCLLFWQQRRQAEIAKKNIQRKCDQLDLQLVSVSFRHRFRDNQNHWRWYTRYHFEFSSQGDDCYQGYLDMYKFNPAQFYIPVHRMS